LFLNYSRIFFFELYTNFFVVRQTEQGCGVDAQNPHVSNIGRMVEDMEMKLRTTLETIYFGKTKDIVNDLRQASGASVLNQRQAFAADISSAMGNRG